MGFADSSVLVVLISALCVYIYRHHVTDWSTVSLDDISSSDVIPVQLLAFFRCLFALIVWGSTSYAVLENEGLKLELRNREGKYVKVVVKHLQRLTFFTFWCWVLKGTYFTLTAAVSVAQVLNIRIEDTIGSDWMQAFCATVWVMYEVCFAVSFLVSIIVTYVLIPDSKKRGDAVNILFKPVALLTHNANVVFMVFELLTNRLQFNAWHFIFAVSFGLVYVVFSWFLYSQIKVFYYFFLDYERKDCIIVYTSLASVLSLFFFFGYGLSSLYQSSPAIAVPVLLAAVYFVTKLTP